MRNTRPKSFPYGRQSCRLALRSTIGERRTVASYYHAGQNSALYSYCSSGHIGTGLAIEVEQCLDDIANGTLDDGNAPYRELQCSDVLEDIATICTVLTESPNVAFEDMTLFKVLDRQDRELPALDVVAYWGGEHWYVVSIESGFSPPMYLVASDNPSEAEESFVEAKSSHVAMDDAAVADYGATLEEAMDNGIGVGPEGTLYDTESIGIYDVARVVESEDYWYDDGLQSFSADSL